MSVEIKKTPFFGGIAAVFAVLVFALPFVIVVMGFREGGPVNREQAGWDGLGAMLGVGILALMSAVVASLVGFVAGAISMMRGESYRLLAWLGVLTGGSILGVIEVAMISGPN